MILFLLLLIAAAGVVAVYAMSGNAGTHDVTLWQWHWSAVPDWVPVVLAASVFGGMFLLYMIYSGLVHGVRVGSMRRRVTTRESAITELRRENQRLREENARVRSELRGNEPAPAWESGRVNEPAPAWESGRVNEPAPAWESGRVNEPAPAWESGRVNEPAPAWESGRVKPVGTTAAADREPVAATNAPDRSRRAAPYRPRSTFGERLRAFFSGREPAGY
jgi:hypothetical protein